MTRKAQINSFVAIWQDAIILGHCIELLTAANHLADDDDPAVGAVLAAIVAHATFRRLAVITTKFTKAAQPQIGTPS